MARGFHVVVGALSQAIQVRCVQGPRECTRRVVGVQEEIRHVPPVYGGQLQEDQQRRGSRQYAGDVRSVQVMVARDEHHAGAFEDGLYGVREREHQAQTRGQKHHPWIEIHARTRNLNQRTECQRLVLRGGYTPWKRCRKRACVAYVQEIRPDSSENVFQGLF